MPQPTVFRESYRINTSITVDEQTNPIITALANGRFALAWTDTVTNVLDDDIRFSFRKADGEALSIFNDDALATSGIVDENEPGVAALADGRVVYTWTETAANGEQDVFAMVRNANGTVLTPRFAVTTVTGVATDDQLKASVIGLDDGKFTISWIDTAPATDTVNVATFDIAGNISLPTTVSAGAPFISNDSVARLTRLANGNVVVSWTKGSADPDTQLKFAIVSDGVNPALIRGETDVNPENVVQEVGGDSSDVIALSDGNFVELFRRAGALNTVQGRLFDADGVALGSRFNILFTGAQGFAGTALQDGRFMVVATTNAINSDIMGQIMFADGTPDGVAFTVSSAGSTQTNPEISTLADGRVVVTYLSREQGTSDIFAKIFDPRETGINLAGTAGADDYRGTAFDDIIISGGGADNIIGGKGNDRLDGGAGIDFLGGEGGDDFYFVDNAADVVIEDTGAGGTADRVFASVSYTLGAGQGIELFSTTDSNGLSPINLTGNEVVNIILGNKGNNSISGGAGADRMTGLDGDDNYVVDDALDAVFEGANKGLDLVRASVSYTLAADQHIEILKTTNDSSQSAINLTGNNLVNNIFGNNGINVINGGGSGDFMSGQFGSDQYFVDNAGDFASEAAGGGAADRVLTSISYTLSQFQEIELFSTTNSFGTDTINLSGNEFANRILGNNGINIINGGLANDFLTGGAQADKFLFNTSLTGASNIDTIADFVHATDDFQLAQSIFLNIGPTLDAIEFKLGTVATTATEHIIYNSTTGALFFDADGVGGAAQTQFAIVTAGTVLDINDFIMF